jgi:hypothetical protein
MTRRFWQSLIAVLAGIYQIDWGLAVDFWICLVCYGLVRMIR